MPEAPRELLEIELGLEEGLEFLRLWMRMESGLLPGQPGSQEEGAWPCLEHSR